MKSRLNIILPVILTLTLLSCEQESKTLVIPIEPFKQLIADNDISLLLVQDSANYIEVWGPAKAVENFSPEIDGDTLHLSNGKSSSAYFETLWAEIHFTDFNSLFLRGGGTVKNQDTLHFSSFGISSNGAMGSVFLNLTCLDLGIGISTGALNIVLNGSSERASVWTTAPGRIDLRNMKTKQMSCRNNSSNDCYLWPTYKLNAEVGYSGKIYYRGDPEILIIPSGQEDSILPLQE